MIKAIFLDIDGTMVSFNTHRVPENTRNVLRDARKKGVKIFVATGRHRSDINNLGDLEFDGYITLNGGYCFVGNKVIFKKPVPPEDVEAFIRYGEEVEHLPCFFVEAERVSADMENEHMTAMMKLVKFEPRPIVPAREFINKEIFQMTAFFSVEREAEIMNCLPGCTATRWYPTFADIVARGVDKSGGLEKIGGYFGFGVDEMMAIGDGGNDITMIKYAGTGIAMGNAGEEVKDVADYVTTSVDDDGVGCALRYFGVV
ncbi:MAG: Cof-type HAD-IIB family hydrolase [Tannerella sp.]|jgi:Cof subfamily protein (haloacid dehalogenase superfamily)|nr:Cof-type HAD-IIB family hydrolase [Tannerella sp.]